MRTPPDDAPILEEPLDAFWTLVGKDKPWKRALKALGQVIFIVLPTAILYTAVVLTPLRFLNQKLDASLPAWLKPFPITDSSFSQYAYFGFAIWLTLILFAVRQYGSKRVEVAKRALSEEVMRELVDRQRTGPGKLLYEWFVRSYRTNIGNNAVVQFCEIAGIDVEKDVSTQEIPKHYKDGKKTATDYLCVINAHSQNSFLAAASSAFDYFSKYDRKRNPRDRITRIFSVPLKLIDQAGTNVPEWTTWKRLHREALFAALWVNKVAGVDTKLHLFTPGHSDNKFFEKADYVICFDPAESSPQRQKLLFLAELANEENCVKICGAPDLYMVFQHEFYLRVTEGHDISHSNDMITLFTRDTYDEVLYALGIDRQFARAVLADLQSHVSTLESAVQDAWLPRIERWTILT